MNKQQLIDMLDRVENTGVHIDKTWINDKCLICISIDEQIGGTLKATWLFDLVTQTVYASDSESYDITETRGTEYYKAVERYSIVEFFDIVVCV